MIFLTIHIPEGRTRMTECKSRYVYYGSLQTNPKHNPSLRFDKNSAKSPANRGTGQANSESQTGVKI